MRALLLLAAVAIAAPALATNKPPAEDPEARADAAAHAAAVSASIAASKSESSSTSDAKASANPTATSGATLEQALAFNYEASAPAAIAPEITPTAPCLRGWSLGGSSPGAGVSFGKTQEIPGCVQRELIRMAVGMGLLDHARFMWCSQAEALNVFGTVEVCMGFGAPPVVEPAKADCSAVESQRDAAEARFNRAVEVCGQDKE
jgi:hypothetical protein